MSKPPPLVHRGGLGPALMGRDGLHTVPSPRSARSARRPPGAGVGSPPHPPCPQLGGNLGGGVSWVTRNDRGSCQWVGVGALPL